jgi:hypothetical protein
MTTIVGALFSPSEACSVGNCLGGHSGSEGRAVFSKFEKGTRPRSVNTRQSYRRSYRGDDSTYTATHWREADIVEPLNSSIRL